MSVSATNPSKNCESAKDAVQFEAEYIARLPRVEWTEAHRRLEKLRMELVAGKSRKLNLKFDSGSAATNINATEDKSRR